MAFAQIAVNGPIMAATEPALDQAVICDQAATLASARTGVPISVMKAITLTETGRTRDGIARPWPWTVNMEGKGMWFDDRTAALAYATAHHDLGARSFDIGCFQINYKWHHEAFATIDQMFDPAANALYAAGFLQQLFAETGDWELAAGAYHSRTPDHAERYRARFASYRAMFLAEDALPLRVTAIAGGTGGGAAPPSHARVNTFPLLQAGGDAAIGSLVPLDARGASGSLFARDGAG
ncbi:transglycosylase SLT domain-containing protein [Maritimibacter fusiformis]|nr:transglycosylase SLT domain-containing protein [Maritimibacter fusiformis]